MDAIHLDDSDNGRHSGATLEVLPMEFHIATGPSLPDLVAIDEAIRVVDPAALVDIDGEMLRVATSLSAADLTSLITAAGFPVNAAQVTQLPSICCGGCSG